MQGFWEKDVYYRVPKEAPFNGLWGVSFLRRRWHQTLQQLNFADKQNFAAIFHWQTDEKNTEVHGQTLYKMKLLREVEPLLPAEDKAKNTSSTCPQYTVLFQETELHKF